MKLVHVFPPWVLPCALCGFESKSSSGKAFFLHLNQGKGGVACARRLGFSLLDVPPGLPPLI
jgi:hypothetical protein